MPIINLQSMPKSKQKLIKLQALILGAVILFPLICFGTYFAFKATIWKGGNKTNQTQVKNNPIKTTKANFNIEFDSSNNWALPVQSSIGTKDIKNRNLLFNYVNGSNKIVFQINEIPKDDPVLMVGQPFNGSQKTNFIEVSEDAISKGVIIYEDLKGQKISRVENPQFPKTYILIDLNSKKLAEKDINNKKPQPDKSLYNTRLNLSPELNINYKDRIIVTEVKYTAVPQDITMMDNQVKKIKISD
jgi:hypothetical protein